MDDKYRIMFLSIFLVGPRKTMGNPSQRQVLDMKMTVDSLNMSVNHLTAPRQALTDS